MEHNFLYRCRKRTETCRYIAGTSICPTRLACSLATSAADMELLLDGIDSLKEDTQQIRFENGALRRQVRVLEQRCQVLAALARKHRTAASMMSTRYESLLNKLDKRDVQTRELQFLLDEAIAMLEEKHGTA